MATTTARLVLDSAAGSLLTSVLAIDDTATLTKLGTGTGLEKTTGLARQTFAAATETQLINASNYTAAKGHKLYIKNTDTTATNYVYVYDDTTSGDPVILKLAGGEFAFMPTNADKTLKAYGTNANTVVESMVFGTDQ